LSRAAHLSNEGGESWIRCSGIPSKVCSCLFGLGRHVSTTPSPSFKGGELGGETGEISLIRMDEWGLVLTNQNLNKLY
jgi:hypothetical protein